MRAFEDPKERAMQDAGYGLRGIHLPRSPVNKPLIYAPRSGRWHHECGWCREHARRREACRWKEENKALVRRFFEAHEGKADLDALDQMLAPDFVSHIRRLPGQQPGREGYKWAIAEYSAAFSDRKFLVEEQVAEADTVVTRFTVRATHDREELLGVAPTDREVAYKAIAIHHISGGKIAEEWTLATTGPKLLGQRLKQEERERERIEQELLVARRIQQASLPKEVPELEGWEISPHYRPAREVGGDFYDFFELEDGRLGVVVGDATGKGVPAALMAAATSSMVR